MAAFHPKAEARFAIDVGWLLYDPGVSGNVLPLPPGPRLRPGQKLPIQTLAPSFDPDRHWLYYDLLERAIGADGVRNIALTGAYGTGKSSVLEHLDSEHPARVVKLSLSTIAPELHDNVQSAAGEESTGGYARTNQIQKEIVKQLLYRLPPEKVPHSRFRRVSVPSRRRARSIAVGAGTALFVVLFGLGLLQPMVESLLPTLWRQIVAYLLLLGISVGFVWTVLLVIRARPTLRASLQTGPATVTLSEQSDSYFDEYLDEIVYFFQASRRDLVVIEDIDRFEDVHVFDTLRALNGLLNSSDQIARRIVFIYAIRDSVFDHIGGDSGDGIEEDPGDQHDRAKDTLKRANRTKFFDVIIPVVPFVSADNARDVMTDVMASTEFEIDPALIRLAARHVADMRLIRNIRNEFEIYRNRLVVPVDHIPDITDDLVFAVVLYKNTHLTDFEKIRYRESTLDQLYSIWRDLVRQNLTAQSNELARLRRDLHLNATKAVRAASLGRLLTAFAETLDEGASAGSTAGTAQLAGPATDDNVHEVQTWATIAGGTAQQITLQAQRAGLITLSFSPEQLAELLGATIDQHEWDTADQDALTEQIAEVEANLYFLRHHTWDGLCERTDFLLDVSTRKLTGSSGRALDGEQTFDTVVDAVLHSDLARDLVRHGFLTSHFALYASSYYGNHLGRDALEYIRRCIEPGEPDATFTLSQTDIEQILREQGADKKDDAALFNDVSIHNVSILDYLLVQRPQAAARVARRLSHRGESEDDFLNTYIQQGSHPGTLLALMAPHWKDVVRYAAIDAPIDPEARPALLDTVLRSLPNDDFDVDHQLGHVLTGMYREIDVICRPQSPEQARIILSLVRASGARVESLEPLNAAARDIALEFRLYPITEQNLRVLVPEGTVALDVLKATSSHAYQYALDRLSDYLDLVDTVENIDTIARPERFAAVLDDIAEKNDAQAIRAFVGRCGPECRVVNLEDVGPTAWPELCASLRTDPTWNNTSSYLEHHGIDRSIAILLAKHKKITDAGGQALEKRIEFAVTILNAGELIPATTTRASLAASLKPGEVPAADLDPETSDLVARLLRKGLLADDSATFSAGILSDWAAHESAIAASKKYGTFVSPAILPPGALPRFIRSPKIDGSVRLVVVRRLPEFLVSANGSQVRAVADALIHRGYRLVYRDLEALRAAGANPTQIVRLIQARGEDLSIKDLKALLEALGGDYRRVAWGGSGRPTFAFTTAHRYVLDRLVGDTIREVKEQTFKTKGEKLVALLRWPDD